MAIRSIVGHGISGAVGGAIFTAVGAKVLADTNHDVFVHKAGTAAIEGLVGGAIVHGGLGLLGAFANPEAQAEIYGYAGSGIVAALTSAVTGGAVLKATGHAGQLAAKHAVAAGATGLGVFAGSAVAVVAAVAILAGTCLCAKRCFSDSPV